jgi:pantoate--beta-alanine ligase
MRIIRGVVEMQKCCLALKRRKISIGFVPTMGALHEGHLSLIRSAKKENDSTCVSIFVNPAQFGPAEDFKRYPRPILNDCAVCKKEKVDFLFFPAREQMYAKGFRSHVEVEELSDMLCGARRGGHFRGVATVVAKLFNIVQPDRAYFGQKDFQQTVILRRMTADLNFPVTIRVLPTVREKHGLAMSSRNAYLSEQEREDALFLSASLREAAAMIKAGERHSGAITRRMRQILCSRKLMNVEYLAIVNPVTLAPVKRIAGGEAIVLAARAGKTRLIDNMLIAI